MRGSGAALAAMLLVVAALPGQGPVTRVPAWDARGVGPLPL